MALIFGVNGACRGIELLKITVDDIQKHSDTLIIVNLVDTKTKVDRSFVVRDEYVKVVEKYQSLRPSDMPNKRFFIHYQNGKCTKQVIGKNKIGAMPKEIACYLNLPNPEQYTGHCFRRTSATILADSGADLTSIKRLGGWKSSTVAEGYIENSIENKAKLSKCITQNIKGNRSFSPQPGTSAQARAEDAILQAAMADPPRTEVPHVNNGNARPTFTEGTSAHSNSQIHNSNRVPSGNNEAVSQTFTECTTQNTQINKTKISVPNKNITLTLQNCTNVTINF